MAYSAIVASAVRVTAQTVDPDYNDPVIDLEEERTDPVPHRYVHGHFRGTQARFSFYFPARENYRGRFFHNTYPMAQSADIGPFPIQFDVAVGDLGFTFESGAYYVQTNNGGLFRVAGADPAIAGYRVNAEAAKFSRKVAARIYGDHRPWGYLFGGSGGAYQTMGAAENTSGVWDGFLPFVPGCNHAIPSMFTVRMHALRVLRQRDRLSVIVDAVAPGGSGDPYAELNEEEAAALREVTAMGFPLRGWYRHAGLDSGYFANISGMIPQLDPTYVEDFWSKPGYLGAAGDSALQQARFSIDSTVLGCEAGPPFTFMLADAPDRDCSDAHLVVLSGRAAGASLPVERSDGHRVRLIMTADASAAGAIRPGDRVRLDNAWTLALQTYHRHQVPDDPAYLGWNQFRGDDGAPIYPQRDVQIGPFGTVNSAGSLLDGKINGKVLLLAALLDIDSFPWQAHWYRQEIRKHLGDTFTDHCAIWFIDNAHHENPLDALQRAHVVSFRGALQQGLRDLARWVEEGVRPPDTRYTIENAQVLLPARASDRGGIQPVISLAANGKQRADIAVGETVHFTATIEVPPGAGKVVSAQWDFGGAGDFPVTADIGAPAERVTLIACHRYDTPGTRFPALRVAAQREGNPDTPYALVENIALVRVVIS